MKDATATMGSILSDSEGGRDACHVAVIAVVAKEKLNPGDRVGLVAKNQEGGPFVADTVKGTIGIVDPFLSKPVEVGDRFWLFLYPRTITSLRHQWTHPAFPDDAGGLVYKSPTDRLRSEYWLRDFISRADVPGYEEAIAAAVAAGEDEDAKYIIFGVDASGEIPAEFWDHLEVVTGRKMKNRPEYFSCAC